jgi:transcriptional regulator with XRE-family HTH domain
MVIERAIQERGWKQNDVARVTGMSQPQVSKWRTGAVDPDDVRVAPIARLLGYDPRDFGITRPEAIERSDRIDSRAGSGDMPLWAERNHDELVRRLDLIIEHFGITS